MKGGFTWIWAAMAVFSAPTLQCHDSAVTYVYVTPAPPPPVERLGVRVDPEMPPGVLEGALEVLRARPGVEVAVRGEVVYVVYETERTSFGQIIDALGSAGLQVRHLERAGPGS